MNRYFHNLQTALKNFHQDWMGEYFFLVLAFYAGFLGYYFHFLWYGLFIWLIYRLFERKKQRRLLVLGLFFCFGLAVGILLVKKETTPIKEKEQYTFMPGDFRQNEGYFSGIGKNSNPSKVKLVMKKFPFKVDEEKILVMEINGKEIPFKKQENFNGFSEKDYQQKEGVYHQVEIQKIKNIKQKKSFSYPFLKLRRQLLLKMESWPVSLRSLYLGMFFRQKDEFFYETSLQYQRSGLWQLFFFSGLQFYCLLAGFRYIFLRIGITHETTKILLFVICFLIFSFVGFKVSFFRIFLWQLLVFLPQGKFSSLDKFSFIILISQFFFPYQLFSFSGQMIYLISLLYLLPLSKTTFYKKVGLPFLFLPLFWWYFFEWSPLTLLFFPLLRKYFLGIFLFLLGGFSLSFFHPFFQGMMSKCFDFFLEVMPSFYLVVGRPPWYLLVIYYLFLWRLFSENPYVFSNFKKVLLFVSFCLLGSWSFFSPFGEMTFVNVRQGDSILLKSPFKKEVVLVDVGGQISFGNQPRASIASQTLIPYLKSRGIHKLHKVILTHADYDHMGDLLEVAKHFPINEIYFQKGSEEKDLMKQTLKQLPSNTKLRNPKEKEQLPIGKGTLFFLGPERGTGSNDDSLQYLWEMGKTRVLFTGDIEEKGEQAFQEKYPQLKVDILKIGHHGSRTSSTLPYLQHLAPKVGIISRGATNSFGHPHEEVLSNLKEAKVKVYDTGENGAISYKFFGNKFFLPQLLQEEEKK